MQKAKIKLINYKKKKTDEYVVMPTKDNEEEGQVKKGGVMIVSNNLSVSI
jgi:hypothetical protein